ncbi:MAG: hypothetical protein ABF291_13925 [Desulfobacterales bacterium]
MRHEFDDLLNPARPLMANGGIRMLLIFVKLNVLAEKRKEVWQTVDSLAAQIKNDIKSKYYEGGDNEVN